MKFGLVIAIFTASLLGGYSEESSQPRPESRRERPVLLVAGQWAWANGGRWLPPRDVGCDEGQPRMAIRPHAVEVEHAPSRRPAFTAIDWRTVDLDCSAAGFLRATDGRGRPGLDSSVSAGFARKAGFQLFAACSNGEISPVEAGRQALSHAFVPIRCADATIDRAALIHGPQAHERVKVIR